MSKNKMSLRALGHAYITKKVQAGYKQKKYRDKKIKVNGKPITKRKIYANATAKLTRQIWNYFCDFLNALLGVKPKSLEEAKEFVQTYIDHLCSDLDAHGKPYSSETIWTYYEAISRVLDLNREDYQLPPKNRDDITRSRNKAGKELSKGKTGKVEKFANLISARHNKELARLRGTDLHYDSKGNICVVIWEGKGGLPRYTPFVGSEEHIEWAVDLMKTAGDGLVFGEGEIPQKFDGQACRALYSCNLYKTIARPLSELTWREQYICRRRNFGARYDKRAVLLSSNATGHGRAEVMPQHYFWRMEEAQAYSGLREKLLSVENGYDEWIAQAIKDKKRIEKRREKNRRKKEERRKRRTGGKQAPVENYGGGDDLPSTPG